MTALYILIFLVLVAAFVTTPFWRRDEAFAGDDPRIAALEAAREAKYREIRDAQLDHAAGKLSDQDFERVNADLRRDAMRILDQLDEARGGGPAA